MKPKSAARAADLIDRLQAAGVIVGYAPLIDLPALGYHVIAFTTLEIVQGQERTVLDGLADIAEVLETHKITGPGDLLCRIVARTNDHLHDVPDIVYALLATLAELCPHPLTVIIERDGNFPEFEIMRDQLQRARTAVASGRARRVQNRSREALLEHC